METLRDGSRVILRSIGPGDRERLRAFITGLSPESRRSRFLCSVAAPSEALLASLTTPAAARDVALIALTGTAGGEQIGEARFSRQADGTAETAVVVGDAWRHRGLAALLMRRLIALAQAQGVRQLYSMDGAQNEDVRELARHLGFHARRDPQDATQVIYTLDLPAHAATATAAPA